MPMKVNHPFACCNFMLRTSQRFRRMLSAADMRHLFYFIPPSAYALPAVSPSLRFASPRLASPRLVSPHLTSFRFPSRHIESNPNSHGPLPRLVQAVDDTENNLPQFAHPAHVACHVCKEILNIYINTYINADER